MDIKTILAQPDAFTKEERATIAKIRKSISDCADTILPYRSEKAAIDQGKTSPLVEQLWEASDSFAANPTPKAAEAVAQAAIKVQCSERIEAELLESHAKFKSQASKELGAIVEAAFDRALKKLKDSQAQAQAALDATASLKDEARIFREKCEAALEAAVHVRAEAKRDYMIFLSMELGI